MIDTSPNSTAIHRETRHWSGRGWAIQVWPDLVIFSSGREVRIDLDGLDKVIVRRRLITWRLIGDQGQLLKLRGFRRAQASDLRVQLRILRVRTELAELTKWYSSVRAEMKRAVGEQRWFPTELTKRLVEATPPLTLRKLIKSLDLTEHLTLFEAEALDSLDMDLRQAVAALNKGILENELITQKEFFNTIESSPLTEEQKKAVICYDSRVLLAAAAGSGKTSVMIARAAYAVKKGICDPSQILLLAYNRAAADELQRRIQKRFEIAGINSSGIRASTFHSLGLSVIGKGTGSKPRLASWLDSGNELGTVIEIVDELRDSDPTFRYKWDLYRLLFARVSTDLNFSEFDGYDKEQRLRGFQTLRNETVKSNGERFIADFLFLNGINYEYERLYEHDVSSEYHSQYRPDFYYPEIGVWHEHWALGLGGKPPRGPGFENYMKSMDWKIKTHRHHQTPLVESTWAEVVFRDGLSKIQSDLEEYGLVFDWNPDREIPNQWAKPMDHPELAKLIRTFMAHIKSNSLTLEQVSKKLREATSKESYFGSRSQLFLDIFWPIHDAWNQRLREQKAVDFEDMLLKAADLLEDGSADFSYELILVDEFQDSSQARTRMVQGLLKKSDRFLLAVGDDWQSVNRFAGADISVMRNFESWFGETLKLALTTTFRCPDGIARVATKFIAKNPKQLRKTMTALNPSDEQTIVVTATPEEGSLDQILENISVESSSEGASVLILGRYNHLKQKVNYSEFQSLDINFQTIHRSKGLEADYIIVLGLTNGHPGFPSSFSDDPVLQLAMPEAEPFPHAEERRLFYVALTRARKKVYLLTSLNTASPFVVELLADPLVENNLTDDGDLEVCPKCNKGVLLKREGAFGEFLSCSRFPACNYTTNN